MKAVSILVILAIANVAFAAKPVAAQDTQKPFNYDEPDLKGFSPPSPVTITPVQDSQENQKPGIYDPVTPKRIYLPDQTKEKSPTPTSQQSVTNAETKTADPANAVHVNNESTAPALPVSKSAPDIG
jgi:hypothetical protein